MSLKVLIKGKGKVFPIYVMKAYRGSKCLTPLTFKSDTRRK